MGSGHHDLLNSVSGALKTYIVVLTNASGITQKVFNLRTSDLGADSLTG